VLIAIGTRPEAVKMAPVVRALQQTPGIDCRVLATAQHREMLDQMFEAFGIVPDWDLDLMTDGQTLATLSAALMSALHRVMSDAAPDLVLVQGDTTTALVTALAAFYLKIPVGHVEAGLRTRDLANPFPEELNRTLLGRMATLHFVPHSNHRDNLVREGIDPSQIFLTGNTVIDALRLMLDRVNGYRHTDLPSLMANGQRTILVTTHRRESFGEPMRQTMEAIADIVERHHDVQVLFPVHLNPHVQSLADEVLRGVPRVHLTEPLSYPDFVRAMASSHLVLTDSGGVQEEAPALGKPVLVLRDTTERSEVVESGAALLVGADKVRITTAVDRLLGDKDAYEAMANACSPYGFGIAAQRIATICSEYLDGGLSLRAPEVSIIVPAYNEAANLPELITRLDGVIEEAGLSAEILVVNDSSADDSRHVLDDLAIRYRRLRPIHKGLPRGMGNAIRVGLAEARGAMVIVTMADGSDDLTKLADLRDRIMRDGYDLAIASRYRKRVDQRNIPFLYRFFSRCFRLISRLILGVPLADLTNAYRAFRLSVVRDVGLQGGGFEISPEITFKVWFTTRRVTEVEATHLRRSRGQSKFSFLKAGPGYGIIMLKALVMRGTKRWFVLDW
jgi:UDP-N-acetylglucosamine 2-epimerase (non-hydrolysing)